MAALPQIDLNFNQESNPCVHLKLKSTFNHFDQTDKSGLIVFEGQHDCYSLSIGE